MFDIANQLLARHSPIAPLGQVDEWTAKCSTFSIHGRLWDFFGLWLLKHWKTRIAYRYWRSKTKIRKEKPKVTYSVALVMALLPAENENQQLTDLPQVDFVLTVGTNNITENFAYWKLGPLFLSWFNVCFHLECANVLYDFYSEVRSL